MDVLEDCDHDRQTIREKLSNMSFEDLQKLKQSIGSKEYNSMFGSNKKSNKKPSSFKRINKNRPRERSSKISAKFPQLENVTKTNIRDPRFDPLCGTYDKNIFKANYKFIQDIRKKEREQLQKAFKKEKDEKKKQKIKSLIQRIDNQNREYEKDEQRKHAEGKSKSIRQSLKKGQQPVFKKKSEQRIENVITQYEGLKSSNKLQKHIEKRYKKLSKKERKKN